MHSGRKYGIITIGKTHSGKTTFAHDLTRRLPSFQILEADAVASFLAAQYPKLNELDKHKAYKELEETLKLALFRTMISHALMGGLNVILSNGNLTLKVRDWSIAMLKQQGYASIGVFFNYPESILRDRISASERSKDILTISKTFDEVYERQSKAFQAPVASEFDHFFIVDHPDQLPGIEEKIFSLVV